MKILTFVIIVLVLTSLIIIESNNLKISDKQDLKILKTEYKNWANQTYSNIHKITGEIVKTDWLP